MLAKKNVNCPNLFHHHVIYVQMFESNLLIYWNLGNVNIRSV